MNSPESESPRLEVVVRRATTADEAGWHAMRRLLWPECPDERHWLEIRELQRGDGCVAVAAARATGEPVGFLELSIRRDHVEGTTSVPVPYVEGWYVDARWRGAGVGSELIAFVGAWASEHGYREIASDAEPGNSASLAAHAALGFREVGRSVHFVKTLGPAGEA